MQMMRTTKFIYNKYSHGKKVKIQILKGFFPFNSQEIVLYRFRHTLSVLSFQEDPMSYFKIVFSVVHRFSLKIVLKCAVTRHGLIFRIGAGMLIVPVTRECKE
jgi:hypothetical protein